MADKKSFILYKLWTPMVMSLEKEQAGELMQAVFAFQSGIDYEITDPVLKSVFEIFKAEFLENDKAWEAECKKRSEAALKREEQKRTQKAQLCTTLHNSAQDTTRTTDSEGEVENDIKKEKTANAVKEKKHRHGDHVLLTDKEYEKLKADYGESEAEKAIAYLNDYIEDKGYKSKSHNMAIRRWVFTAIKEQEQRKKRIEEQEKKEKARSGTKNQFNNFEQRDNNMSDIEAMMMKRRVAT